MHRNLRWATVTGPMPPSASTLPYPTASWGRRILALFVDWIASSLVASAFLGVRALPFGALVAGVDPKGSDNLWILLVFVVETTVLTTLTGGSFGKLATRLRTVRTARLGADGQGQDPRPLDPLRSLARQIMVAVLVPPLVFRHDGRGLHDLAAGTATVTLATYRTVFRGLPD